MEGLRELWRRMLSCVRGKREKKEVCAECSINGLNDGDSSSDQSVRHRRETSFNLGAGFGLLYLIATSKIELSKMLEMQTQMEFLLQNVKEESSKLSDLNNNLDYSTIDVPEGSNSDAHPSLQIHTASCSLPKSQKIPQEGMDQLEAELEAELERLQLHLDTENDLSKHHQQQNIKVTIKDTTSIRSHSTGFGEVIDLEEAGTEVHNYGVPPYELERRLHELLEARQQDRIEELEVALECAKQKLHEKEMEISWWKDTAQLISQHTHPNMVQQLFTRLDGHESVQ